MSTVFRLVSQYFWLLCLGFGIFNYQKARSALVTLRAGSEVGQGEMYLKRFAIGVNAPWVIMGLGQVLGFTPTVWYYFRPQDGNPFVIAWLAIILLTNCVYAWWVLFAGGAEKVRSMNLLAVIRQPTPQSLWLIKLFAVLAVLILPVWVFLAMSMNAPLPR